MNTVELLRAVLYGVPGEPQPVIVGDGESPLVAAAKWLDIKNGFCPDGGMPVPQSLVPAFEHFAAHGGVYVATFEFTIPAEDPKPDAIVEGPKAAMG